MAGATSTRNARTGTKLPGRGDLLTEQICAIIETAHRSGVKSLSYQGLEVNFFEAGDRAETLVLDQPQDGETSQGTGDIVAPALLSMDEKVLMEELRLADLMTNDPMSYEQEMIDAQLQPQVPHANDGQEPR